MKPSKGFCLKPNGTLTIKGRLAFFVIRHWGFFKFFFKFVRLGKFKSPDGTEYWGIKVSGPW